VFGVVARARTYRNLAYVLAAFPLGALYLLLLLAALILDLLLIAVRAVLLVVVTLLYWLGSALTLLLATAMRVVALTGAALINAVMLTLAAGRRVAQRPSRSTDLSTFAPLRFSAVNARIDRIWQPVEQGLERLRQPLGPWRWWIVTPALCWGVAVLEHIAIVRWLQRDLPPIARAARSDSPAPFPWSLLSYLLAKLPFGLLGGALVGFAVDWLVVLKITPQLRTWAGLLFGVVLVLATLHAIEGLVRLWARFTGAVIGSHDAVRRLREAEQRAAQERRKAERAEQSRRDLIVNVGHELRTPIASIRAHVESIALALDDQATLPPEALRSYLGIVQREAERLGTLVDELLALARSETDRLQLTIAPVDAAAVIDEVYQALAPLARRERQVTLVRDVPPSAPPLLADRQRLVQVLLNLLRNAITYTPAGGIVSVSLQQADPDHLVLAVADTGSGIAPADLERIFERFYRTDASRARASGGFGLGLAIVRELVEAMGGAITVESRLGEGSCFAVRLPIAAAATS
jgi:signal transduction histidine kinase